MLVLLFNREREFLGEVLVDGGVSRRLVLNEQGEREIGPSVRLWQTRGVPVRREIRSRADGTRRLVFYIEYVAMRSPSFHSALGRWASDHDVTLIELPDACLPLWETLASLPFEPAERFAFLLALKQTPRHLLSEWKQPLDEAARLAEHELEEKRQAVGVLKRRMQSRLLDPFAGQKNQAAKKTV